MLPEELNDLCKTLYLASIKAKQDLGSLVLFLELLPALEHESFHVPCSPFPWLSTPLTAVLNTVCVELQAVPLLSVDVAIMEVLCLEWKGWSTVRGERSS